jgi:hypothetical protein
MVGVDFSVRKGYSSRGVQEGVKCAFSLQFLSTAIIVLIYAVSFQI